MEIPFVGAEGLELGLGEKAKADLQSEARRNG